MATINTRLYPTIGAAEVDVLNQYSTLQTGVAGALVKIVTGAANPQNVFGYSPAQVGNNYNVNAGVFIFDNRPEVKWKVTPTTSGDTAYNAIGFTTWSTLEFDNNQFPLKFSNKRALELGAVRSGEAVPILQRAATLGIWGNYIDQSVGNVQPGNLVVVSRSGNGLVAAVDPSNATWFNASGTNATAPFQYTPASVIGKWLTSLPTSSNTGIANEWSSYGGYALFTYSLNK